MNNGRRGCNPRYVIITTWPWHRVIPALPPGRVESEGMLSLETNLST
jgi:hypothetical protein